MGSTGAVQILQFNCMPYINMLNFKYWSKFFLFFLKIWTQHLSSVLNPFSGIPGARLQGTCGGGGELCDPWLPPAQGSPTQPGQPGHGRLTTFPWKAYSNLSFFFFWGRWVVEEEAYILLFYINYLLFSRVGGGDGWMEGNILLTEYFILLTLQLLPVRHKRCVDLIMLLCILCFIIKTTWKELPFFIL